MKELTKVTEIQVSYFPANYNNPTIKTCFDAYIELKEFFPEHEIALKEQFVVMYLNRANRVIGVYKLSNGGITGTVSDVRLILATALKTVASSIIICHNHPSGNLNASAADVFITNQIKEAAKLMDIGLSDHIIIAPNNKYLSMKEEGFL